MIAIVRGVGLCLLLAMNLHPLRDSYAASDVTKTPPGYTMVCSVDETDTQHLDIAVYPDSIDDWTIAQKLCRKFAVAFVFQVVEPKPVDALPPDGGSGSSLEDPFVFKKPLYQFELIAVMLDFRNRVPDRRNTKGYLFRSPAGTYLLYAVFDTAAGRKVLCYDISHFAGYAKSGD
ncbi:MAG TPA: hypothetical protein VMT54_12295 [Candidatus Cybelea sp.]|nr:hypothetical protein [Candidatus Cybelea sp.]